MFAWSLVVEAYPPRLLPNAPKKPRHLYRVEQHELGRSKVAPPTASPRTNAEELLQPVA